jgi:hypothetical protein
VQEKAAHEDAVLERKRALEVEQENKRRAAETRRAVRTGFGGDASFLAA